MKLESALMLIVFQIISFGVTISSFQVFKAAFKKKDWLMLIGGTIYLGCGLLFVIYSSIVPFVWDSNTLDLTYFWTLIFSVPISYFLFTYISKTKKFKSAMKKFLYEEEDTESLSKSSRKSPFIEKFEDILIVIFYLAIFLGIIFLLVKLVKYFWYL